MRLTIRYLCKPRNRRKSENEMWEAILEEFTKLPDVDFAYPTMRRFDHRLEGKGAVSKAEPEVEEAAAEVARAEPALSRR